jgi:hypothetical protein
MYLLRCSRHGDLLQVIDLITRECITGNSCNERVLFFIHFCFSIFKEWRKYRGCWSCRIMKSSNGSTGCRRLQVWINYAKVETIS